MEEKKNITRKAGTPTKKPATKSPAKESGGAGKNIWRYLWKFRGIIISVPVLLYAIGQAFQNASRLPDKVGMDLQATGEFAVIIGRPVAVLVPLLITIGSILLTCFTKRPLFPWLISIFTLVLPVLIWVINSYPA